MAAQLLPDTEPQRVAHWRAAALERAGFSREDAKALAQRPDVDVHAAVALLERGCPPELATRILL